VSRTFRSSTLKSDSLLRISFPFQMSEPVTMPTVSTAARSSKERCGAPVRLRGYVWARTDAPAWVSVCVRACVCQTMTRRFAVCPPSLCVSLQTSTSVRRAEGCVLAAGSA